jgi:hypothetical protein
MLVLHSEMSFFVSDIDTGYRIQDTGAPPRVIGRVGHHKHKRS